MESHLRLGIKKVNEIWIKSMLLFRKSQAHYDLNFLLRSILFYLGGHDEKGSNGAFSQSKMQYDSTGMFHWCPSRNLQDSLMDRQEAAMTVLQVITKHFGLIVYVL